MSQSKISQAQKALLTSIAECGVVPQNTLYDNPSEKAAAIRRITSLENRSLIAASLSDEETGIRKLFLTGDGWRYVMTKDLLPKARWAEQIKPFLHIKASALELSILACYLRDGEARAGRVLAIPRDDVARTITRLNLRKIAEEENF
jgi:hypothetical protein